MTYLFAAYTIVFLLIVGYVFTISKRQKDAVKELQLLRQLDDEEDRM